MDLLKESAWPGNVRELKMIIANLKGTAIDGVLSFESAARLVGWGRSKAGKSSWLISHKEFKKSVLKPSEKAYFESLLEQAGGNVSNAAKIAEIDRKNFYQKLKALGLENFTRDGVHTCGKSETTFVV
jgi:transcriptional regulator of acetoin/glycerol metabolism